MINAPQLLAQVDSQAMLNAALDLEKRAYSSESLDDYKAAADAFEKCSKQLPLNVKVERAAGFIYLDKLQEPELAYPHLEKAYAADPSEAGWAYSLAKAAWLIGKTDRQIQVLQDAAKRHPDDKDIASALVMAQAPATRPDKNSELRASALALQVQAYTTQSQADYQTAADAMEKYTLVVANDLEVERSVGFLYLEKLKDAAKAYPHLDKAYSASPDDPSWGYLLARAAEELKKTDRQIQVLSELVKRNPGDKALSSALSQAQTSATEEKNAQLLQAAFSLETTAYTTQSPADFKAAAEALENCSRQLPANLLVERSVGFIYLDKLNQPERAYPHLEKAYSMNLDDPSWAYSLAKAAKLTGRTDRQLSVLRDSARHHPDDKDIAAALTDAQSSVTTHPAPDLVERNAKARKAALDLQTHAYTTQNYADYEAAGSAMATYSQLCPDDLEIERSVGFVYLEKLNDPARAYPHLEKAYNLAPNDISWGLLLAKAAGELDKTDRQIQVLWEVVKRDPNNQDSAAALADALSSKADRAANPAGFKSARLRKAAFAAETRAYTTQTQADYQVAADSMEKYLSIVPEDLEAQRSVGFIDLDKLKDAGKAYPHLEKAYQLSPADAGWGSLLANAAGQLGKSDRQLQVLHDVVRRNPSNANSHLELAKALDKAGNHDDAGIEFAAALKLDGSDKEILIANAQFLHTRGRDPEAQQLDDKVLEKDPHSVAALALRGDLHRSDWDLSQAQADYQQALALNPESENAKTGLTEIHRNKYPTLDTSYYYFKGTDHFMQQGLYNSISFSDSDHIYSSLGFNTGYFRDGPSRDPSIIRYQETISVEDRISNIVSIRGGFGAFQQRAKEAFGFDLGATWRPTNESWVDASYRTADPVTDSMYTVSHGLSQDILGFTAGYQYNSDLALKLAASRSQYSDDVTREFIHVEPAYTLWQAIQLKLAAEFETVRYSQQLPGGGGTNWYNTYSPVVEVEPPITNWLSVHMRAEFPFVQSAEQWGSNLSLELKWHPGNQLTVKAGVFYVSVPESISSYSGSGLDASVSYRF